jgi:REP element-mobilizing transposase RayT
MSTKYKAVIPDSGYFVTITIVGWIDIFTRPEQKHAIIESLRYCQKEKGLEIYAYCLMSSHLHMVCSAKTSYAMICGLNEMQNAHELCIK